MSFDRHDPFPARLVEKRLLTGPGSDRPTLHVALSLAGSGIAHEPGDLVAIFARNDPALVSAVLARLGLEASTSTTIPASAALGEPARTMPIGQALTERLALGAPPLRLLRAAIDLISDDDEALALEDLCDDDAALDAYLEEHDLLDFLEEHPSLQLSAAELGPLLAPLMPRTYSIASSAIAHPDEVHLTVGLIEWTRNGRLRRGVASQHLVRMQVEDTIGLYATASRHFRLPDADVPLVLVGPGTGIAPFRGFWQAGHRGPLWLFFGARTRAHDFYYEPELQAALAAGTLARLDLAFSRDQPERIYVQQRLREHADELWQWLSRGAHVYLCGDASKMAPDVERVLVDIAASHGEDGPAWLEAMKSTKRYRRDVY